MSLVQESVEEFISRCPMDDTDISTSIGSYAYGIPLIDGINSARNDMKIINLENTGFEKNELDSYLPRIMNIDDISNIDEFFNVDESYILANLEMILESNTVPLSQSVGTIMPEQPSNQSHAIQIVHKLESTYKPRYKSDYFSQDGTVRDPRYVLDQKGNHFITLKMPPGIQGIVRIDWVTVLTQNGIRYSMPYKFQRSNKSLDISDCNPFYMLIDADHFGIMKLYLVLIKSKQDELKNIQSLQVFPPLQNTSNMTDTNLLTPKKLIEKYQLNKSQLAFTFCSISTDGTSCVPEWNTTIYSTVLTERSTDPPKKRAITCPKCSHHFEIALDGANDIGHEKIIKKRKKQA